MLVRSNAQPEHGTDHLVTVAFGGRPAGTERSIGHFANAMPIRIPFEESLVHSGIFDTLVNLVSKQISKAKKHERLAYLDMARAAHKQGLQVPPAQVAVTLSPKLSRPECCLYPVEGPYDLFFCFLEGEDSVALSVSLSFHLHA